MTLIKPLPKFGILQRDKLRVLFEDPMFLCRGNLNKLLKEQNKAQSAKKKFSCNPTINIAFASVKEFFGCSQSWIKMEELKRLDDDFEYTD